MKDLLRAVLVYGSKESIRQCLIGASYHSGTIFCKNGITIGYNGNFSATIYSPKTGITYTSESLGLFHRFKTLM